MALADVMQAIEQHRFAAEVNLAAGTKAFRRGLRSHALFRKLDEFAREPQARREIVERIASLSRAEIDTRYENGFDAALSAYLTALGDTAEPELIAEAASAAASAPNCWWTVAISRELMMRAVATGHLQSAPVVYLDANVLTSAASWKETLAEEFRQWFDERRVDSSVESRDLVLRVLNFAQSAGQHGTSVATPPDNEEPIVSLNLRRPKKGRQRHGTRPTQIRHRSRMAHAQ